jgi:hypothetical protein
MDERARRKRSILRTEAHSLLQVVQKLNELIREPKINFPEVRYQINVTRFHADHVEQKLQKLEPKPPPKPPRAVRRRRAVR